MLVGVASSAASANDPILEHDVLPLLQKRCMGCHGGLIQKGKLDLRTLPSMLKGGKSGPAVVAGKLDDSELWQQVIDNDMPSEGEPLSADEKQLLRKWIESGLPTWTQRKDKRDNPLLPADKKHEPARVAQAIDQHIDAALKAANVKPAPVADDAEFLRRVYLDLTGRVPTPQQAASFLDDQSPGKRAKLIDTLLASPQFGEQFGRTWREWIAPPELPSDMNSGRQPIEQTRALGKWFAKQFNDNHTWDRIVRDVLTANGELKNNPQLIYFGLVGQNAQVTAEGSARTVASLFMGVQLQCAQCHDDPYRDWAQHEFWALAAFFGGTRGDFKKVEEKPGESQIVIPKSAFRNAGTKVQISFLRGPTPKDKKATWRPRFVDWLTANDNPYFAKAFSNRAWFYFFSRGIVNPIDDFRELNPPSHPGLIALLGNEFAASGHDVKHLIRAICNSKTYQRTSAVTHDLNDQQRAAQTALFGRAPVRVMSPDMLFDSLKLAFGDPKLDLRSIDPKDGNTNGESAAVGDVVLQFQRDFCINEEDTTDFTHGIPQMLTLMNHPRLQAGSKALDEHLKQQKDLTPPQVVEWLYLATLSRRPSDEESAEAVDYVKNASDAIDAYKDVLWMLVNRSEFMLIR